MQVVPFPLDSKSLTVALWVQFTHRDDTGNILTLYGVDSVSVPRNKRIMLQVQKKNIKLPIK